MANLNQTIAKFRKEKNHNQKNTKMEKKDRKKWNDGVHEGYWGCELIRWASISTLLRRHRVPTHKFPSTDAWVGAAE